MLIDRANTFGIILDDISIVSKISEHWFYAFYMFSDTFEFWARVYTGC